ncbi:MAG: hemolysin III family protein [Syntrophotaleaceae bacterium]
MGSLFKILDHSSIYVLIAGTYTPFALVYLRGHWGWTLFAVVWVLTLYGNFVQTFYVNRFKILAPLAYLFMGWLLLFAAKPAVEFIPRGGIELLLAGGLFYSSGMIFYAWNRLSFNHAIWHLFVLAGSLCHYLAVLFYVIP